MGPVSGVRAEFAPISMAAGLVFNAFIKVSLSHSLLLPLNNGGSTGEKEVFLLETVGVALVKAMVTCTAEMTTLFGTFAAFRTGRTGMEEIGGGRGSCVGRSCCCKNSC